MIAQGQPLASVRNGKPVRYNDWHRIDAPPPESYAPGFPVSVIIPYFSRPEELARTLAALEGQSWPRDLFEVVVVDDGSPDPLEPPASTPLEVKVIRQENRGFGAARARNTGVRAAAHDVMLFLDADMMPEKGWIAAHAHWHNAVPDALTLGLRGHVDVDGLDVDAVRNRSGTLRELFEGRKTEGVWFESHLERTGDMTSKADDGFQIVASGNLGVRRAYFDRVGGFNESLAQWGGEDVEFGFRAFARGGLLIPVRDGFAWHQGLFGVGREEKRESLRLNMAKWAHTIAHPSYRKGVSGRTYVVPRYVVTLGADGASAEEVFAAAVNVLSSQIHDMVLRLELPEDYPERELLCRHFDPDPRVQVGPLQSVLDEFPTSLFHVELPANRWLLPETMGWLHAHLGQAVRCRTAFPDGAPASITRIWALHRARSTSRDVAAFGDVVDKQFRDLPPAPGPNGPPHNSGRRRWIRHKGSFRRAWSRLRAELRLVNSRATARRFAGWLVGAAIRRVCASLGAVRLPPAARAAPRLEEENLGVEIVALGDRSRRVFRASHCVAQALGDRHHDVAIVDTAALGRGAAKAGIPLVALDEAPPMLSVPAINPWVDNPINRARGAGSGIGALGPLHLLPPDCPADQVLRADNRAALGVIRYLEDVQGFHTDAAARAGTLVRLAATGVVVHLADRDEEMVPYLGDELFALMTREVRDLDDDDREALSIAMRRAALRDHSLTSRARQVAERVLADPPRLPLVSILMATRRPEMLVDALAAVRQQTYPRLELILSLHGEMFGEVLPGAAGTHVPMTVLRPDPKLALGAVLNAAVEASRGTLLAKMDDDDLYGRDHIWDLVLAHQYSRAPLVGKWTKFVHLASTNRILHYPDLAVERYGKTVMGGGALMVERRELERVGGWRRYPRSGTDQELVQSIRRQGSDRVYLTHSSGFLLVRHGKNHTWEVGESWFLVGQGCKVHPLRPGLAGVDPSRLNRLVAGGHAALANRIRTSLGKNAAGRPAVDSVGELVEYLVETAPTDVRRAAAGDLREALVRGAFDDGLLMAGTLGRTPDLRAEKVVSHKFRCLWLCIPKAASRSIKAQLIACDPDARVIEDRSLPEVYAMHPQARDYFTFAFVRNPCQRAFSFFAEKYVQSSASKRKWFIDPYFGNSPEFSFDELCQWLNTPWGSDAFADRHWLSQSPQLLLEDGRLPDFIGQYESLEADWTACCDRLGMPPHPLPRLNVTAERKLDEEGRPRVADLPKDELIARCESLLRRRYAEDFALIGKLSGSRR